VLSIFQFCWNSHVNSLQVLIGLFLHVVRAPEVVITFLSRIGLSIGTSSIDNAIQSLTRQAEARAKTIGSTLRVNLAFDNLDVTLRNLVPTQDGRWETMFHLCTGTLIPLVLPIGVTWEHLQCAEQIWKNLGYDKLESKDKNTKRVPFFQLDRKLRERYPDVRKGRRHLSRRQRFVVHLYLKSLIEWGPNYFKQFASKLDELAPEVIMALPLQKTTQVPLRAEDENVSKTSGTITALTKFLRQMGIWMSDEDGLFTRIGNAIMFVHCDLGALEKLMSMLRIRSEDVSPEQRFQFVIPVLGLFHLKMAAADAIWRIFINHRTKSGKDDHNSLFSFMANLRPRETGTFTSKKGPGFRRMHEVIEHVRIVSFLDMWRVKMAKTNPGLLSLDAFAESEPKFEQLVEIAEDMAAEIWGKDQTIQDLRELEERDKSYENVRLLDELLVLYEELSYGMNMGDIGRVESVFLPWIFVFKACGKFKYAAYMTRTLWNLHFIYPYEVS
jgi:hypothetical protein